MPINLLGYVIINNFQATSLSSLIVSKVPHCIYPTLDNDLSTPGTVPPQGALFHCSWQNRVCFLPQSCLVSKNYIFLFHNLCHLAIISWLCIDWKAPSDSPGIISAKHPSSIPMRCWFWRGFQFHFFRSWIWIGNFWYADMSDDYGVEEFLTLDYRKIKWDVTLQNCSILLKLFYNLNINEAFEYSSLALILIFTRHVFNAKLSNSDFIHLNR